MATRRRTYAKWRAERVANATWAERVERALPEYKRLRPRDPDEAELLRRRGTPARLIGPVRE